VSIYRGSGGAGTTADTAALDEVTQYAQEAAQSSNSAASSASSASTSAINAASSAAAASTSAANAGTSETNAANSATAAANSATAAANSATAAATSATNSEQSYQNTLAIYGSTVDVSNAVAAAQAAQTGAETAETNASGSATSAATSATNSTNSATAAATSATASANSATASASSATASAASETASAASATAASGSATSAANSATAASTSASAASASATSAANSAAAAAASLDNFDDRYLGPKASDPTLDNDGNPLVTGALYFNTTDTVMKIWDGSSWIAAASAQVAAFTKYAYTATAGQTVFTGVDDNTITLALTVGTEIVMLNGIVLESGTDYTATATAVTLLSGATAGDELNVFAFGSFQVADVVPASTGGTFQNNISVSGNVDATTFTQGGQPLEAGAKEGIFWENSTVVSSDYTITTNKNAGTFGPIEIADGVTVTINDGSVWTIV